MLHFSLRKQLRYNFIYLQQVRTSETE